MGKAATQTRQNRTITVDFHDETTYAHLLAMARRFLECVLAFILSLGFQLKHKTTCCGEVHDAPLTLHPCPSAWDVYLAVFQCTRCKAVFTVLPHFCLALSSYTPAVARNALLATHGGLSLELCAVISHISPMAIYRLVCAFGHQSLVPVLTRCRLPLPTYVLADEKHSHCLRDRGVFAHDCQGPCDLALGYTEEASAAALTQSYQAFQRAAFQHEPTYRVSRSSH